MRFVGIDISKLMHNCVVIDEIGDTILPSRSFNNDCEGFAPLRERLYGLEDDVKIGLEATGHYGQNLKLFLEANGFSFMEFNPLLVSRFVGSKTLRNTKTDPIDAHNIARHPSTGTLRQPCGRSPATWTLGSGAEAPSSGHAGGSVSGGKHPASLRGLLRRQGGEVPWPGGSGSSSGPSPRIGIFFRNPGKCHHKSSGIFS